MDALALQGRPASLVAGESWRACDLDGTLLNTLGDLTDSVNYAMERMGHSSTNMLRNVYQHTMSEMQQKFSSQLNDRFSDRLSKALKTKDSDQP